MIEIRGTYNTALCYTDELEKTAAGQIKAVCDQQAFAASKIRIMPDVHAGLGCTIGTTMTIIDKVVPGMVGVDIGCGMETVRLNERSIDFAKLDALIRSQIPCGREVRDTPHTLNADIDLTELRCSPYVNLLRAQRSIGTLGGGNHFIEVDRGEQGELFLVVHSGSRHIGNEVAKYYQEEGFHALCGNARCQIDETIRQMKESGNTKEIHKTIKELKKRRAMMPPIPKDLAYVEGSLFDDYIHDMRIIQHFAVLNRKAMTEVILGGIGLTRVEEFTTIHNYIDTDAMILRKGAVSAKLGEKLLIPINMRDGSLICIGRGNEDWNCSAPHGAGRLMSRRDAFAALSMEEYKAEMGGIFTTCVVPDTLDESPMAYKSMDEIVAQIGPTADIIERIKPVYNFKAAE
ncbi:MAG: RtcB family protein [Bacillota bacterium]|nr:RtcB family protein [Bacillota bacterium]